MLKRAGTMRWVLSQQWDLVPSLYSLSFASQVNHCVGIGLARNLRRLEDASEAADASDTHVGLAMKRLYELLHTGEYVDDLGQRRPIRGDVSKIQRILGLTPLQNAVIRNMFFMSSRLPGTRQVRKSIGRLLTAARVARIKLHLRRTLPKRFAPKSYKQPFQSKRS